MWWATTLITLIFVAVVVYFFIKYSLREVVISRNVQLVGPIADAKTPTKYAGEIPLSFNEKDGAVFSYSGWILIDDWMYGQGSERCIFNKGADDQSTNCPGVYLDSTSNSMIVKIDTFGDADRVEIENLPARKWLHFALVVNQTAVDVYIDGILRKHHSLRKLPRQNNGAVQIAPNGGWSGQIGTLYYFRYALSQPEITGQVGTAPYEDTTKSKIPLPPYFDNTWYIGRF